MDNGTALGLVQSVEYFMSRSWIMDLGSKPRVLPSTITERETGGTKAQDKVGWVRACRVCKVCRVADTGLVMHR